MTTKLFIVAQVLLAAVATSGAKVGILGVPTGKEISHEKRLIYETRLMATQQHRDSGLRGLMSKKGSKGGMGKGKGKGKGKGGMMSSKKGKACELFDTEEAFIMPNATTVIDQGGSSSNVGTTYIWSPSLLIDPESQEPLENSFVTGTCTRTLEVLPGGGGGGICNLAIVDSTGSSVSFSGAMGGADEESFLAITGGTGELASVIGEAALLPLPIEQPVTDVLDAEAYGVLVSIGLIVCTPQEFPADDDHSESDDADPWW